MTKLDYQSEGTLKTIAMEKDKISLVKHKRYHQWNKRLKRQNNTSEAEEIPSVKHKTEKTK
jgi:hypothetical protein